MTPRSIDLAALRRRAPAPRREPPAPAPDDWHARLHFETSDTTDPFLGDLADLTAELGDPMAAAMRIAEGSRTKRGRKKTPTRE